MRTLISVLVLYVITMTHHLYGGIVLVSTERLVLSAIFTVVIAATILAYRLGRTRRWSRIAYWTLVTLWVTAIGVAEGGYNHALYVILRLSGAGSEVFQRLYPDGIEGAASSDDLFFQGTGVLTLLAIIPILVTATRGRARRAAPSEV